MRKQFESFGSIHNHILEHARRDGWPVYDAAISSVLIGDLAGAHRFFNRMSEWKTRGYALEHKLKDDSAALAAIVDQPELFRAAILDLIQQKRQLMRLPLDPNCLDALDSTEKP